MIHDDIIAVIEEICPLAGQESWDNSGWQVGDPSDVTTGVVLCVDVTEEIIAEAVARGANLVIAHHPLLFRGAKRLTGRDRVERCVAAAFRSGVSVYSAHTSCDSAREGVSVEMASMLGLEYVAPLEESGLGAVGHLPGPMPWRDFVTRVKMTFGTEVVRVSRPATENLTVRRVALCGGSGGDFAARASGVADVLVTADCKHNYFLDNTGDILLVDAGHFETEQCTKQIFYRAITEKFPNFAVWKSAAEKNPVLYL